MTAMFNRTALLAAAVGALFVLSGCPKKGPVPVAPKPRRPEAAPAPTKKKRPPDCPKTDIESSPPAVGYSARVVVESNNLSARGIKLVTDAAQPGLNPADMEAMTIEGVDDLITALKADPYNVDATYHLASTYARIGRAQCSINLLERLALLRKLDSQRPKVEANVDKLLGRNGNSLDPNFTDLRATEPFRQAVENLIAPL